MELTLTAIQSQIDVLQKNYWLFMYSHLRTGVWEELFKKHLDEHYPEKPDYQPLEENLPISLKAGSFYTVEKGSFKGNYRALGNLEATLNTETWTREKRSGDLRYEDKIQLKEVTSLRNSKRTNFPRVIWQKDELSWLTYYEGVLILQQVYKEVSIELELVYQGKEIHKYVIPVKYSLFEMVEGDSIKHKGRVNGAHVVQPDLNRKQEYPLTHVVREIMRRQNLTRVELDELLNVFTANSDNLFSFSSNSIPNIKSSILGTMFKWNITWSNFTRAIKVLGYTDLNLSIRAVKRGRVKDCDIITTVNMRLC